MSLEAAVQENTAALNNLAKLLVGLQGLGAQPAPTTAAPSASKPAEPNPAAKEAAIQASGAAPSFETVKGPFLALVNANRAAALAVLAQFKIARLSDAKPGQYAEILAAVKAS